MRKCLEIFQSVVKQLRQEILPLWSDEGVFNIIVDIFLHEPEKFLDLFPCMGPFHWCRVGLRVAGKLLKGTEIDDAMVECGIFGPVVISSVLDDTHYAQAFTGMLIVEDLVMGMAWRAFWKVHDVKDYPVLVDVQVIITKLQKQQRCVKLFDKALTKIDKLQDDFEKFLRAAEERSELCAYLSLWLKIVAINKNNVSAGREGNWDLHVAVTGDSLP